MDIRGRRRSTNVEDRRGMRVGRPVIGIGLGGLAIMLVLSLLGINPLPFMAGLQQAQQQNPQMQPSDQPYQEGAEEAALREMTEVVLADTEDTWSQAAARATASQYQAPTLVLFTETRAVRVRRRERGIGAVLLPAGPEGLPRHVLLQRAASAVRRARAISRRPMSSRTRSAITSRTWSARRGRCARRRSRPARRRPTTCRCGWSCRRTASRACGRPPRKRSRQLLSAGRHRGSARRGERHRRRPHPAPDPGLRGARLVHARQRRAAPALVHARIRSGTARQLRHLCRGPAVIGTLVYL